MWTQNRIALENECRYTVSDGEETYGWLTTIEHPEQPGMDELPALFRSGYDFGGCTGIIRCRSRDKADGEERTFTLSSMTGGEADEN